MSGDSASPKHLVSVLVIAGACTLLACRLLPTGQQWAAVLTASRIRSRRRDGRSFRCSLHPASWHREGPESLGLSSDKLAELAANFQKKYIDTHRLKGALLAVVRHGEVVAVWELGSYKTDTVFKLYSITKVFTAIAGLQMTESLGITVDEPVSNLVPEWPATVNVQKELADPQPANEQLLLRHCLSHTGGFSNTLPTVHPTSAFRPVERRRLQARLRGKQAPAKDLREVVEREAWEPHIYAPGEHFNYCSVGSQIIARAVETASGLNIAEYMKKHIFGPVGMTNTGFVIDESLADNCVSTDYHPRVISAVSDGLPGPWWQRLRLKCRGILARLLRRPFLDNLKPAGSGVISPKKLWDRSLELFHPEAGVVGTGRDFLRWLAMLTNGGRCKDGSGEARQVLSTSILESLATPVTAELQAPFALDAPEMSGALFPVHGPSDRIPRCRPFNSLPGQRFSLGACVVVDPTKAGLPLRASGSWHWMGFASTYFFVNPKEELAACFLTQLISHRTYPIHDELLKGVHDCLL
eukprot:TRINITY_DN64475_c0_g1_i1.p1 TRINITY_DN64475_c0_g1~~TRINITY_DN64475_c0_g1_i1.p1  ORF type:complete len:549 (+),score=64.14 TRINITY_DN64475_c0_g1_i1:72-1649(+)